jgi:hypothetical protein
MAGLGVAATSPGTARPGAPPVAPGALVTAADAESSAWYCTGQSTPTGQVAVGSLVLTNTTSRAVSGRVSAVTDTAASATIALTVPARGQLVTSSPPTASGTWVSQVVTLDGGGVAVSQFVHGPSGWSEAPCQSGTSQQWYFPSGATSGSNVLYLSLFNPTSTSDVVDLSFATPSGLTRPINYQGLVVKPGQTLVENVGSYVQEQPSVATTVSTRTGRVVASELQVLAIKGNGLAILPGSPRTDVEWVVPQSLEIPGGSSDIDVFNPGSTTEVVTVRVHLSSGGQTTPFSVHVLPGTVWVLATSAQTRIPVGDAYSAALTATGGPGVVMGRVVSAPAGSPSPQSGMANAIDSLSAASPTKEWVVPSPGTAASPAAPGVIPAHLALANEGTSTESYTVSALTRNGRHTVASGTLDASSFASVGDVLLFDSGLNPFLVTASGPMAVSEDVGPTGAYGVVTMPGIPVAAPLDG